MILKKIRHIFIFLVLYGCNPIKNIDYSHSNNNVKKKVLSDDQLDNWQNKDIVSDTIAGISIDKAYNKIIKDKKGEPILVAILDTEIDINHEDLIETIWTNLKEIPNNNIDDDKNGYIDDVNGWNFLGNNKGEAIIYQNLACTRIIRKFEKIFKRNGGKEEFNGVKKDSLLYKKALETYKKEFDGIMQRKQQADFYIESYPRALKTIKSFFPDGKYTYKQVDSLYKLHESDEKRGLVNDIHFIRHVTRYNLSQEIFDDFKKKTYDEFNTTFNNNYYDKDITGDDENNINDTNYGNNNVSKNAILQYHATQVSGLIAANRDNDKGIKGFSNNIKIMPLCIATIGGAEHDKDEALAIRYAVNNGAKVINMSIGKEFSLNSEWVKEALLYAQEKDVIVIVACGNDAKNMDKEIFYPIDYNEDTGLEFCSNYINVGAITYQPNFNLVANFSNYGKKNVDIFAPGQDLYTTDATSGYVRNMGTSLACALTSGLAALIRSHYPKLSASQVKQIILDSGVSYDMEVIVPGTKDKKVKFSELSKSGKVVNVYNALLMAAEVSKKRK
jgi:cell wall-associated protease